MTMSNRIAVFDDGVIRQLSNTSVSLRPERVAVNPAEGSVDNSFVGMVEELIYLGDHVRTRVNVCGTDEFIVKIPNAQN